MSICRAIRWTIRSPKDCRSLKVGRAGKCCSKAWRGAITSPSASSTRRLRARAGTGRWWARPPPSPISSSTGSHTGAADGFNVLAPTLPHGLKDFAELVIPELQRRGLFRTEYQGRTLREHLGLARPANQHTR